MNRFFEILRNNWIAFTIAGGIVLVIILTLVLLFRSPRFPDGRSGSDEKSDTVSQAQEQTFQQLSQYLRDNHGGLLTSERIKQPQASRETIKIVTFRQQFRFLNQSLISELSEDFAKRFKMTTAIRLGCDSYPAEGTCYEMDFKKENVIWMRVLLESAQLLYPEKGKKSEYKDLVDVNGQVKPTEKSRKTARLAIVIDDLGYRMDVFNNLITLDYDITYAVLPQQAYSRETAEIATHAGRQVMLHLPMQPKDWPRFDPGLGALLLRDTPEEISEKIALNLTSVPYVTGVNNHMGSAYTQYDEGLDVMMRVLNKNTLFFLDSKTAPGRAAKSAAAKHQVPYLSRDVFLDNDRNAILIEKQLRKAVKLAKKRGWAIAIGHPYDITYTVLADQLPGLDQQGVRITKVVDLLN